MEVRLVKIVPFRYWLYRCGEIEIRAYNSNSYSAHRGEKEVWISSVPDTLDEVGNSIVERVRVRVIEGEKLVREERFVRRNPEKPFSVEDAAEIAKRYL
jgi:hypothetical protein